MSDHCIDTGDIVLHRPSGERWLVAYVRDDRVAWCGWPEGEAQLTDCELITKASAQGKSKLLQQLADSNHDDARARYARWRLAD